jgi:putative transposase
MTKEDRLTRFGQEYLETLFASFSGRLYGLRSHKQQALVACARQVMAEQEVERHLFTRSGHGNRQERCEMEQAGRILRAQASRQQVFQTIVALLSEGVIRPAEEKRPARKDHAQIKEQVRACG